jgi:CubicO group peptidase (beta-lactamase class C family)
MPPGAGPAVWHNGGTYGGSSFLAVDPAGRIAVAAFGNRGPRLTSPLDGASWRLFDALRRHAGGDGG